MLSLKLNGQELPIADLVNLQQQFMQCLTDNDDNTEPFEQLITGGGNITAQTRLNIYRNAYRLRLREAIDNDHEMLGIYLGDDLFEQMVNGYIASHPSRFRSLRQFANQLPDYLRITPPFSAHPIISKLAAFERLLMDVFDAPESQRATLQQLQTLAPEQWPAMQLRFHPSMQFFKSQWNSVESWQRLRAEQPLDPATSQPDSLWLLWRGEDRLSQFRSCTALEWNSLQLAVRGADFAELCEQAAEYIAEDDIGTTMATQLQQWLQDGLISQLVLGL